MTNPISEKSPGVGRCSKCGKKLGGPGFVFQDPLPNGEWETLCGVCWRKKHPLPKRTAKEAIDARQVPDNG